MKRAVAFVVAVLSVVAWTRIGAQEAADPGIRKLTETYRAAFNKGDAKGLASLYTPEAVRLAPDGRLSIGRDAIQKNYETAFAGPMKGATLTIHPGKLQTVTGDVVVEEGTYDLAGGSGPMKGRYVSTAVRQRGEWKLASRVTTPEMTGTK